MVDGADVLCGDAGGAGGAGEQRDRTGPSGKAAVCASHCTTQAGWLPGRQTETAAQEPPRRGGWMRTEIDGRRAGGLR